MLGNTLCFYMILYGVFLKIIVVGTSNSVMGNTGFISSLRFNHEVIQLSCGRTPFYFHLKTIIDNKELIESCDLLLLDHYVNDVTFYRLKIGVIYEKQLGQFYKYLTSLNVQILNLFFPIQDLESHKAKSYYDLALTLSKIYKLSVLNLNSYSFLPHHFADEIHLNHDASYVLGLEMGRVLTNKLIKEKPKGGRCISMPFSVVNISDVRGRNLKYCYSNSLVNIDYVDVLEEVIIERHPNEKLLSIGYLRLRGVDGMSGVKINNSYQKGLGDLGYFHEAIDGDVNGSVSISPILENDLEVSNLMGRGVSRGDFNYCYLTELLFYNDVIESECNTASRALFDVELSNLVSMLCRLLPKIEQNYKLPNLASKTIDLLRDSAISLENEDLSLSKDIMHLANLARPSGALIKKKLEQYRIKLSQK